MHDKRVDSLEREMLDSLPLGEARLQRPESVVRYTKTSEQLLTESRARCNDRPLNTISEIQSSTENLRCQSIPVVPGKWGLKGLTRKTVWDADHILPVVEGGGECDLGNLRTLCLLCHREQTLALRRRRALADFPARLEE